MAYRANGTTLAVRSRTATTRPRPPVLLVPGTGATAADWDVVAASLAEDRDVHAVDLRGHGRSAWPGTYSIDLMADDLADLLPRLVPEPAGELDVVGHSLGGLVACRVAARSPRSLRRLVLEDVGVPHPREPAMPDRPPGDLDFDWAMVQQIRPEIDAADPGWRDVLRRIAVPVLALTGGPESFVCSRHVEELAATVRTGRTARIDAGHEIHQNRPDAFLAAVRAFLDD